MKPIPLETREQLQEDLAYVLEKVEAIKKGKEPNCKILDQHYTDPLVNENITVPLTEEKGEYVHLKAVGHIVLNILTQGRVPKEFYERLSIIKAPSYIMELVEMENDAG